LPDGLQGVIVASVDPTGPAEEAEILEGDVVLEINRQPVRHLADYARVVATLRPGDAAVFYCYEPAEGVRALRVVHVEPTRP
jgi:S1-C subfamily serine protease